MAELKVFAIRDIKISTYNRPFTEINEIQAMRGLKVVTLDGNSQISHFPEDFELMELGTFDETTGRFNLYDSPKFIISALSFKKPGAPVPATLSEAIKAQEQPNA